MLLRLLSSGSFFNQCFYPDAEGAAGGSVDPATTATPEDGGEQEPALTIDELKALNKKYQQEAASRRVALKAEKEKAQKLEERLQKFEKSVKSLSGEEEEPSQVSPELEQIREQALKAQLMLDLTYVAIDHEVPKDFIKYFITDISDEINALEEGEELDNEIIEKVAVKFRNLGGGVKKEFKTSVTSEKGAGTPPPSGQQVAMTPEQFAKLSITEKGQMYVKDQAQYTTLMKQARELNLI